MPRLRKSVSGGLKLYFGAIGVVTTGNLVLRYGRLLTRDCGASISCSASTSAVLPAATAVMVSLVVGLVVSVCAVYAYLYAREGGGAL
jgi:hypothetical protein